MAFSYGDTPRSTPACYDMDREHMERRWQVMLDAGYTMITIEASIVSCGDDVREVLAVFPAAWRYDIGEQRIECLFTGFEHNITEFLSVGVTVLKNR